MDFFVNYNLYTSLESSEDESEFQDYLTPNEYEPSVPRPRRRPDDDDIDYNPSADEQVCIHIHMLLICLLFTLGYTENNVYVCRTMTDPRHAAVEHHLFLTGDRRFRTTTFGYYYFY